MYDEIMAIQNVESSNIRAIDYEDITNTLTIYFHSGYVYKFFGVPQNVVDALVKAPSIGQYFHKYIKDSYPYDRTTKRV